MWSLIILFVFGMIVGLFIMHKKILNSWTTRFVIVIAAVFFALIGSGILTEIVSTEAKFSQIETVELASMRSTDSISGSFLIASGGINTEIEYIYYEILSDGSYRPRRINAERNYVVVFEDMQQSGKLIVNSCTYEPKEDWPKHFILGKRMCKTRYEFHIPEGSLVQEFRIE